MPETGFLTITRKDLEETEPYRLNLILQLLQGRMAGIESLAKSLGAAVNAFNAGTPILYGTWAVLGTDYPPGGYLNSLYVVTDRSDVVYQSQYVSNVATWVYVTGIMLDTFANRPASLGTADANFWFYATNTGVWYRWDGAAWLRVNPTIIQDTHANRGAYAATIPGQIYRESDRTVKYVASGGNWVYTDGHYAAAAASRPADLGANDAGFLFWDTTNLNWERWTGAAWEVTSPLTTLGDTLYRDGNRPVRLAGNTAATRKFLRQTGTGAASAAPAWDTVDTGDITSGALALARGGTHADLSGTGPGFLKQAGAGSDVTVAALAVGDLPAHTHSAIYAASNGSAALGSGVTSYLSALGSVASYYTEANRHQSIPVDVTFSKLAVSISSAQPATGTLVVTVRKNGAATALTVTIAAGAAAGSITIDAANSAAFAAGDTIAVEVVNNAATNSAIIAAWTMLGVSA